MDNRIKAVTFDEEKHRYFYNGRELRGVTGAIGKLMGKSFPDTDVVKLATMDKYIFDSSGSVVE